MVAAALRVVGNLVTGDHDQTQFVLYCSVLPYLLRFLVSPNETMRKETCWIISNITAGVESQIQVRDKLLYFCLIKQI